MVFVIVGSMRIEWKTTAVVALLVAVAAVPAIAGMASADSHATNETDAPESNLSVGTGQQLSTIISMAGDDVRTEIENTAIEVRIERAVSGEMTAFLEERVEELRDRGSEIRDEYADVTEAYRDGDISRSQYAQRIALLNGRAENVQRSLGTLQERVSMVPVTESDARDLNASIEEATEEVDDVSGAGAAALLNRFTGQATGELEFRVDDGIRIEAESEAGERSRELRRPDDSNDSLTVPQEDALTAAREALSKQDGNWTLTRASVHEESGYYRFAFGLAMAGESGEAEVRVDGSSGDVVRLEEEIEREEDDREDDDIDEREPTLLVTDGTPAPNATITVAVRVDGEPVENATVTLDGEVLGQTDADGTLDVTLPEGESELRTEVGDEDAELEFEFEDKQDDEDEQEDEDVQDDVSVDATLDDDTVTITLTDDEGGIAGAGVYLEGDHVGETDKDGQASFTIADDTEDFDVEFVKGDDEVKAEYEVDGDSLVQTEGPEGESDGETEEDS